MVKEWISKTLPSKANYIDVGARFIIPLVYLVFCIIYFTSVGGYDNDNINTYGNRTTETIVQL